MKSYLSARLSLAVGAALLAAAAGRAATFTAVTGGGNWNSGATWNSSSFPGAADTAIIGVGITVTVSDTEACATLNINSTGICLNNGTLTVGTALASPTPGGTLTQGAGATLNLNGTTTVTTLGAGAAGNTVSYGGAGQTVKAVAYQNLTLAGSGSKTMTGVTSIVNLTGNGTCTASLPASTVISGGISINGATITTGSGFTVSGATFVLSGEIKVGANGTFGDVVIYPGATFATGNGDIPTFSGNYTNNGLTTIGGSADIWIYSGVNKALVGFITNNGVNMTGTYTNYGVFEAQKTLTLPAGSGLVNLGTLILENNDSAAPAFSQLDSSATNSVFDWSGAGITIGVGVVTGNFGNVIVGTTTGGGANVSLAGAVIAGNLTLTNNDPTTLWPASGSIAGTVTFGNTGGGTFPANFSIGGFNQTIAGTVTVPANATLTVTGTGAGTWSRSVGTFTANASSTVAFTGDEPTIGGSVATTFGTLLIGSTATNAIAGGSGFAVNTALTINPGGQLDVTALSGGTLTLGNSAALTNSGTIVGSLVTGTSSKVFVGTDGGYGTNDIATGTGTGVGALTLTTGSTLNFDINSTAASPNDLLVVGGPLTLNNTVFNLKAPGAGASIDTANDYTLVSAGSVSGTPVLNWVTGFVPDDSTNYTLVVDGGTITLHYTAPSTGPSGPPVGSPILAATNNAGVITLSWDSVTYSGYNVEAETNSTGLGAGWTDTGSGTNSPYTVTVDPSNPSVFYRLAHP